MITRRYKGSLWITLAANEVFQVKAHGQALFRVTMAYPWPEKQADELPVRKIRSLLRDRKPYSIALEWRFRKELL